MTDTTGLQFGWVRETTPGTTPGSPRVRLGRVMADNLRYEPQYESSEEIRSDRMRADPMKLDEASDGTIGIEMSYPVPDSMLSDLHASLFFSDWVNTPTRFNDGTADSVITDIGTVANTLAFTTGAAFVVGHLVRNTGFAAAANNGLFPVTTGGATSLVSTGSGWTADAAPAANARVKVVGFQGASADIAAAAGGLTSTVLNFTTLGLAVGQWIKIGGTAAGNRFATAALNDWARITAIAAGALTLDHLSSGWTTDAGTGKTIRVFFGDYLRNGTTQVSGTIERGFMRQAVPTYILQPGMTVAGHQLTIDAAKRITGTWTMQGMAGMAEGTTTIDAIPDAAPDNTAYPVMAASTNVGRITEAGTAVVGPNWIRSLSLTWNNNLRPGGAVGTLGPVRIGNGEADLEVSVSTYFGSDTLFAKLKNGTVTSLTARVQKNNMAMIYTLPRVTLTKGFPTNPAINQDVILQLGGTLSRDALTGVHYQLDRLEWFES